MLRVGNLSIPLSATEEEIAQQLLRRLRIPREALLSWKIHRKSVDARDKGDVHFVLTVDVTLREEAAVLRRLKPGVAVRVQPAPRSSFLARHLPGRRWWWARGLRGCLPR